MTRRTAVNLGAVAVYFGLTLVLSYAVWARYDGVGYDPAWASPDRLWLWLVALHVAVGAVLGRWWALALPVAWAALSAGAGGYDTPVAIGLAFSLPFIWLPATAAGVAGRKLASRLRGGQGRVWPAVVVLVVVVGGQAALAGLASGDAPADRPPAGFDAIDEEDGTYGGVGLGDPADRVFAVHGRARVLGEYDRRLPTGVSDDEFPTTPLFVGPRWWACYEHVCFWFDRDPDARRPSGAGLRPPAAQVRGILLTSPGAATRRGVEIGDSLGDVDDRYPELDCVAGDWLDGERFCAGELDGTEVWFGGHPVDVIVVGSGFLGHRP